MHDQGSGSSGCAAPTGGGGGAPPADGLDEDDRHELAELLGGLVRRSGRHLVADLSPLEVECWASRFWELCCGQELTGADPEEVFGGGAIEQAAAQRSPEALAVLRALAAVAPARYADRAGTEAERLAGAGVGEPAWSALIGRARASEAWLCHDPVDDDAASVLVAFEAPGSQTASVQIDHNLGGIARDAAVLPVPISEVLRTMQRADRPAGRCCHRIDLDEAAARWRAAFGQLDAVSDPQVSGSLRELRALLHARLRALPAGASLPPAPRQRRPPASSWCRSSSPPTRRPRSPRPPGPRPAGSSRSRVEILDYGLDAVTGTPLRFSPSMVEAFVRDWRPRAPDADGMARALLPGVLAAWIRFAGRRRELPAAAVTAALRAIPGRPGIGGGATVSPSHSVPVSPTGACTPAAVADDELVVHDLLQSVHAPGGAGSLVGQAQ